VYYVENIENNYLVNTIFEGAFLINSEFEILERFNLNSGLQDNTCIYSYSPNKFSNYQNVLWLGLNTGISKVEVSSPFRFFTDRYFSSNHIIFDVLEFNNSVYINTNNGLFYLALDESSGESKLYEIDCDENISGLLIYNKNLYAYNNNKIYRIKNGIADLVNDQGLSGLFTSSVNSDRIIGVDNNQLVYLIKSGEEFKIDKRVKRFSRDIGVKVEDYEGNIWVQHTYDLDLFLYDIYKDSGQHINTDIFQDQEYHVIKYNNKVFFSTVDNLYTFDYEIKEIVTPQNLDPILKENFKNTISIKEDINGGVWIISPYTGNNNITHLIKEQNGGYTNDSIQFKRFSALRVKSVYPLKDGIVWLETSQGLLTYNTNFSTTYDSDFYTLLREVTITNDSVIFNGSYINKVDSMDQIIRHPQSFIPSIDHQNNNIKFVFSSTFYVQEDNTEYCYKLENFDKNWSEWTTDSKKEYTNLNHGDYIFKVKARNVFGLESIVSEYKFHISRPWYLSLVAILLYAMLFVLIVAVIVNLNTQRLIIEKNKLEQKVKERTADLRQANEEIKTQFEEIEAQRDEIEAQRDMVVEQKDKIEKINEEITDSIEYAQYIQNAILPQEDFREKLLPDHFIFYKHKNIVSGDFYWVTEIEERVIVAAADCTGHGVPGAFMSMLGVSFLNDIVNKEYITHPGVILRRLRKEVIQALQQKGKSGEQRDGMDIALCSIDFNNMEMQFSGANNPLYIIRDKKEQPIEEARLLEDIEFNLYEIKGDKMPIAIYERMDKFSLHEIKLKKGDCLYLFSDGYADQFGGEHGKKYKYKPFKKLLLANADKSMKEQFNILNLTLNTWQRGYEQVDDILVIGIRI
ncbi:MAG: hypothetical protein C0597_00425, partial [Marinilabiliales bacterium]